MYSSSSCSTCGALYSSFETHHPCEAGCLLCLLADIWIPGKQGRLTGCLPCLLEDAIRREILEAESHGLHRATVENYIEPHPGSDSDSDAERNYIEHVLTRLESKGWRRAQRPVQPDSASESKPVENAATDAKGASKSKEAHEPASQVKRWVSLEELSSTMKIQSIDEKPWWKTPGHFRPGGSQPSVREDFAKIRERCSILPYGSMERGAHGYPTGSPHGPAMYPLTTWKVFRRTSAMTDIV